MKKIFISILVLISALTMQAQNVLTPEQQLEKAQKELEEAKKALITPFHYSLVEPTHIQFNLFMHSSITIVTQGHQHLQRRFQAGFLTIIEGRKLWRITTQMTIQGTEYGAGNRTTLYSCLIHIS